MAEFRPFRVVDRVRESDTITSFHLEPVDPSHWRAFRPGQHLAFRLPGDRPGETVLRTYSVSSSPREGGRYRVTIKREPAPRSSGAGIGSGHFHDAVAVGDLVEADGPRGGFVLDEGSTRAVLLLSGGVGLTPMVSMLHSLSACEGRPVYFVHAADNGDLHALADEVEGLAASRPGIHVHFCYRAPTGRDMTRGRHGSSGFITRETLQRLLPQDDYEVYLCGPAPFMQAMFTTLRSLGIARERIQYEFFGDAVPLDPAPAPAAPLAPPLAPSAKEAAAADTPVVRFARSGIEAVWTPSSPSLLDFAEAQGIDAPFSCRAGICSTCRTGLTGGKVAYFEEPLDPPGEGEVLLCCSRPVRSVTLDL